MRKILALVLALAMILMVGAAFAGEEEPEPAATNDPAVPSGTYASFNTTNGATITISNANAGQNYEFYQIFEAIPSADGKSVSYKMITDKTMPTNNFFEVDAAGNVILKGNQVEGSEEVTYPAKDSEGNLTAEAIAWLDEKKATIGRKVAEVEAVASGEQVMGNLPFGYYFISTTTGTVVTVDTTTPSASVEDKNPPTKVDKEITGVTDGSYDEDGEKALAQVGTTVTFEARIPIKNGALDYSFKDDMSTGLTNNEDVAVYLVNENAAVADGAANVNNTCGTITYPTTGDYEISIVFDNAWLKENVGKDIIVRYSATINKDAVIGVTGNPNTARIEWGNTENPLTKEDTVKVYSAKVGVMKYEGDKSANKPLEGAGFKLKNNDDKYYKLVEGVVTWVDTEAAGDEHLSTAEGTVAAFTGLADGTYYLVETTVPSGFNKAADTKVTIAAHDYTAENLEQVYNVENKSGTELPTTGGIGTTIFYVVGGLLVLGAAIILITRRKAESK